MANYATVKLGAVSGKGMIEVKNIIFRWRGLGLSTGSPFTSCVTSGNCSTSRLLLTVKWVGS